MDQEWTWTGSGPKLYNFVLLLNFLGFFDVNLRSVNEAHILYKIGTNGIVPSLL